MCEVYLLLSGNGDGWLFLVIVLISFTFSGHRTVDLMLYKPDFSL